MLSKLNFESLIQLGLHLLMNGPKSFLFVLATLLFLRIIVSSNWKPKRSENEAIT